MPELSKPDPVKPGDAVAIAAPAGCLDQEGTAHLHEAVSILEGLGLHVKTTPDPKRRQGYLAADDSERAEELMRLFSDPTVRAIFCARGGYGSQRIVPLLDTRVIRENPKVFVGSSDITALLIYLLEQCHMVCFHGPNVATKLFADRKALKTRKSLGEALEKGIPMETPPCKPLKHGVGRGRIKGGCLSLIAATLGTPYEIDLTDAILFLEDVNEPVYRIDRMLIHMKHARKLERITGVILGDMVACTETAGVDVEAVVLDLFRDRKIPIVAEFPSGHGQANLTFPLGVDVTLDGDQGRILFNERGVSLP